jgi:putative tryptophan/tyrosine transport system substrate-binding protein
MHRRAFIAGLGCAAAWPVVARAEQPEKVWRVGYLSPVSATKSSVAFFDAFRSKLEELGYIEGKNLKLDVRRAEDDYARLPSLATELVALSPNVIVASTTDAVSALQRATSSVPIVMATGNDPIVYGFVKSLAKPGGNITGLSSLGSETAAKTLELLHVVVPNARRIAILMSLNVTHEFLVKEAHAAAQTLGLTVFPVMARTPADLDDAFEKMQNENCEALFVLPDAGTTPKVVELADRWRLPAIYQVFVYVDMGGLVSYSANIYPQFQEAAVYVDKILKGASPADLPVEQPTKLFLQVNLKTAKSLGLTIPDSVLARADKVIE